MRTTAFAVIILAAFAAACAERKAESRPDDQGVRSSSEKAHQSLDHEAHGD